MKNVFKYILILVLIMLGNVGHSQCDPEFHIIGTTSNPNHATAHPTISNRYILTPAINEKGGRIWNKAFLSLDNDFEITAKLNFGSNSGNGDGAGNHGSDGIAFVLQTDANGNSAGSVGGGIGYSGISPSVAVEFDTHLNITNSPCSGSDCPLTFTNGDAKDHMAIQKNGVGSHNSQNGQVDMLWPSGINGPHVLGNIETGSDFDVKFVWTAATNTLQVFFDDLTAPAVATLTYDFVNDADIFNGNPIVYWGFTGATGLYNNQHEVEIVTANVPLSISYPNSLYCSSNTYSTIQQSVTGISGQQGGLFTSSPNGLSIDGTTGEINASASQAGTYTITYTVDNTIPSTDPNYIYCGATTTTLQIDEDPDFTYSKYSFCSSETNPEPNYIATSGGTFTSIPSTGLSLNSGTGIINLTGSIPGTYEIIYTTLTCENMIVPGHTVDILAAPNVDAGADLDVCNDGSQITLTATGASSYVWYSSLDPNFNYPNIINNGVPFSWSWVGNTYTFVVVGTGPTGCTVTDEVTVTLLDQPNADAGSSQSNICVGTPVTMAGSVTGTVGTTNWTTNGDGTFDDASSLTAIYSPGAADNSTGSVILTLQANPLSPCTTVDSDNMTVTFTTTVSNNSVAISPSSPTPNDDLTANINSTCVDVSSNDWRLNGTSIAPLNFPFNTSGTSGLTSKSTNPEVLSISGASPIISQGISGNCFEFTSQGELEANISTINPSNGISISVWTYTYNQSSNFRRWVSLNSSSGTELLLRKSSTNFIEAVVWAGGGIPDWDEDHIYESSQVQNNVWQHWVLTYDNFNTMILYKNGDEEIFSTTTIGQGINDITQIKINTNSVSGWYNGKLDEVMVFDRVITPEQATALYNSGDPDYEKIVKEETNCGESWTLNSTPYNHIGNEGTATLSSAVSIPSVSISTQPSSGADVCQGSTASTMTVVASSGSGNYTYQWYTCQSDGSSPVIINGETNASFIPPTSSVGTTYYIVIVTDDEANCGSETSAVVSQTVDESITVAAGADQTVCGNDVVNISGTISGGVSTGTWSASAAGTFGNTTDLSTTFTPGASLLGGGTVDLTLTSAANGACPAVTDQLTLTVNSADAGFTYAFSEYCADETDPSPTITGATGGTFSSTTGLVINSTTGEIDLTGSTAGTYTISYTLTGACTNSSTFDVTITTPTVGFNYGGQTSFCLGTTPPSVTYTAPTGGVFSSDNVNLIVDPNTGEIDLVNSLPGSYEITYDYSSTNQMGADITSNTLALISQTNGTSMNSLGNRIAVGYPVLNPHNTYGYNGDVKVFDWDGSSWNQLGNVNSTRGAGGRTGSSIALSADGQTLAVISPRLSNGTSVNPSGNTYWSNGVLEIFNWDGSSWNLMGTPFFMPIGSTEDNFALDINDDGTIVAIGECKQGLNTTTTEGQVSVYEWDGSSWNAKGAVLAGENIGDQFGFSLSLNGTGNRIAVGTPFNDANKGEVKLYEWSNSAWNIIEEFNGVSATKLGHAVSLNSTGAKIAISESDYNSNAGAVSIYVEGTNSWNLVGSQIEGSISGDAFGFKVELNADGNRFLASSIAGNGYAKLYELSGSSWVLKGTETGDVSGDKFGKAIDINGIGDRFIVGAPYFDNNGVNNTGLARAFQMAKTCPKPLSVTITTLPVTAGNDFSMCEGESFTLSASGGLTYSWSPTTGLDDPTSATPVATPPAGNYTYTVTASDATGCTGTAQQLLTVLPNDVATFSYSSCCYFTTDNDPTPIFTGTSGGTYSSSTNLTIVPSTGEIDLDDSAPGNYEVTYATSSSNACPVTSSQNVLIMNENNCNVLQFNTAGNAQLNSGDKYDITLDQGGINGAVWCNSPLNLNYPFHISALLNFGSNDASGADGIAFVLQESSNTLAPFGVIGYGGVSPSFGIEFDTHFNPLTDPPANNSTSEDHLAIQLNGDLNHSTSNALIPPFDLGNIEDGNDHELTIYWDPNPDNSSTTVEGTINVYFDNVLIATLDRDLKSDFTSSNNGLVYWGFTAGTGGFSNLQSFEYVNSSFWSGRTPTTLSDNINEWQGDVSLPVETVTDPIDNVTTYSCGSWFNPCNWTASFVPDYNIDVVIPQQSSNTNPVINFTQNIFLNYSVLFLDMNGDGVVNHDDRNEGEAFAKSLKLENDAKLFIKTDEGAQIKVQE